MFLPPSHAQVVLLPTSEAYPFVPELLMECMQKPIAFGCSAVWLLTHAGWPKKLLSIG
jgi:hypothetical protein